MSKLRYRRIVFLLLLISSPFILSFTFGWTKNPYSLSAISEAMADESNNRSNIGTEYDNLNKEFEKKADNIVENESSDKSKDHFIDEADDDSSLGAQHEEVIIKSSPVIATVVHNAKLYDAVKGKVIGDLEQGQQVEILQDRSWSWYEIAFGDIKGWVKAKALDIPPDPPTNLSRYSNEQLEAFINSKHLDSKTPYLIWVHIDTQLVHIFKGSLDKWYLHKTMVCSTGTNDSPTTRGLFTVSDRDTWMYTPRLGSGAKNWVRFNNTYLFHSVAYAKDGKTVIDDTLGVRSSAGCVRLSLDDSQWIYDNIESGTTVWVD